MEKSLTPFRPVNENLVRLVKCNVLTCFSTDPTPALVLELACQAYNWADTLISRFETENPLPHPLACRPGCDFCCYNQIEVTPLEAFAIWDYIGNWSSPERARLQKKVAISAAKKARMTKAEVARARRQFPCPFLKDRLCAIYPVRPLLCRAMHSLDAGHCQQSLRQAQSLIPDQYYLHRDEIVWSILQGLVEGLKEAGCQVSAQDLTLATAWFFQVHRGIIENWLHGERVFPDSPPS
jgi:Fe-S-cluster containining protein|uniref:YkgJ family cysteine cluster protein n=1 Tax=Desulfobacca acetoxidans TaxID=60893 RepID=A0A7C3SHI3_9BACT